MQKQIGSRNSSHSRKCLIWWSAAAPAGSAPQAPPPLHAAIIPLAAFLQAFNFPEFSSRCFFQPLQQSFITDGTFQLISSQEEPQLLLRTGGAEELQRSALVPEKKNRSQLSSSHDLYMCLTLTHHWNIVTRVFMCVCACTCAAAAERQSAHSRAAPPCGELHVYFVK